MSQVRRIPGGVNRRPGSYPKNIGRNVRIVIPTTNYIVAATPRTGSSLLCEGLCATGIAGRPAEVFAPDFRGMWYKHWLLGPDTSFSDYVHTAVRHGTTSNGVFGLKIQWMHVALLARDLELPCGDGVLDLLFPKAQFINIVRRDRRAQALSWFRAITTNEWWSFKDPKDDSAPPLAPAFDRAAVYELEGHLERQQNGWEQYFRKFRLNPLVVEYETLAADYRGQVARTLEFLGLDKGAAKLIPEPRLARQADDLTESWRRLMERPSA